MYSSTYEHVQMGCSWVWKWRTNSTGMHKVLIWSEACIFHSIQKKAVLNLVAYVGAEGMLATAGFTSNVVKLWEPPSTDEGIIQSPRHCIPLGEPEECKIWR